VSAWREKNAFRIYAFTIASGSKRRVAKLMSDCNASTYLEQANSRVFQRFPAGFARERRRVKREGFLMKYFRTVFSGTSALFPYALRADSLVD